MASSKQTTFTALRDASRQDHQIIGRHSLEFFQGFDFFHHLGLDRNMRERFCDHEWFRDRAAFCEKHDQNGFDLGYATLPLEAFEPAVRKVFSAPGKSIYLPESAPGA